MIVQGKLQIQGGVIHVIVERCFDGSKVLRRLKSNQPKQEAPTLALDDEGSETGFPKPKNFRR
jgi:error-prone DNA polymerase